MTTNATGAATLPHSERRSPAGAAGLERPVAFRIVAIDPGSTSTKVAVCLDGVVVASASLPGGDHAERRLAITEWLTSVLDADGAGGGPIHAVVGRGGLVRPIPAGTYAVSDALVADLRAGVRGQHPANLGGLLARDLGDTLGVPAFVVDPVAVDEFAPIARVAGIADLERVSLLHALNVRAVARRDCAARGVPLEAANLVVAHLGGGISIVAIEAGRLVDANNAHEEGPFSPERCGGLPSGQVAHLVQSGRLEDWASARRFLHTEGGVKAYLGTADLIEVERRIASGDATAASVLEAMAYQVGKCIGAYAAALGGRVDAVLLTGGAAHCGPLVDAVAPMIEWIAPVRVHPGEDELTALAEGATRVLAGLDPPRDYASSIINRDQENA